MDSLELLVEQAGSAELDNDPFFHNALVIEYDGKAGDLLEDHFMDLDREMNRK